MARRSLSHSIRSALGIETKGLASRVLSQPRVWTTPGQPYYNNWSVDRAVEEGYAFNPYIFRAVELIASNAGARRVVLREDDPVDGRIIPREEQTPAQRKMLYLFSRRTNPWEVSAVWRHRFYCQYLLSSRGVFVEVVRNRSGTLWGMILLDPDRVEIVPTEVIDEDGRLLRANPIGNFRITVGAVDRDGGFNYLPPYDPDSDPAEFPSGVLWIRSPHPTILARGMSPMEAAGLSADLDRYARYYNRTFMQNDGRPGGVLAVKGNLSPETEAKLLARFGGGPGQQGRTSVIEADSMTWQDTSNHPRDMQWVDMMKQMRGDATIAFGVPISMLGDASGRTFDNADAEYSTFWESPMLPLLRMCDSQFDVLTPSGYADDDYFTHNVDDVWVLGRHKREEADRAAEDLVRGSITIDDYREATGRERLNIPATRVLYLPAGTVVAGDGTPGRDDDAETVSALPMLGGGGGAGGGQPPGAAAPGAPPAAYGLPAPPAADRLDPMRVSSVRADMLTQRQLPAGGDPVEVKSRGSEGEQRRPRPSGGPGPAAADVDHRR